MLISFAAKHGKTNIIEALLISGLEFDTTHFRIAVNDWPDHVVQSSDLDVQKSICDRIGCKNLLDEIVYAINDFTDRRCKTWNKINWLIVTISMRDYTFNDPKLLKAINRLWSEMSPSIISCCNNSNVDDVISNDTTKIIKLMINIGISGVKGTI